VKTPEILFIDIDQVMVHPTKIGVTVKPGLRVPSIPQHLDMSGHLHADAVAFGVTAEYRLRGVMNHAGANPNVGHYTSHVRDSQGNWHWIDDATVVDSSISKLQQYDPSQKAGQMIPKIVAYVKIHMHEDENAIRNRVAKPQPGPRGFLHPQIAFDDTLGLKDLKGLCKERGILPMITKNTKKIKSLIALINRANSQDSTFGMRVKGWLLTTLLSTGTKVDLRLGKVELAQRLTDFMKLQPARTSSPQPIVRQQQSDIGRNMVTQAALDAADARIAELDAQATLDAQQALDAANARIAALEQTIADLRRNALLAEGEAVTTDLVRELARQLPATPSIPRGTKRSADDSLDGSPETKKRRVFRQFEEMCRGIDLTAGEQERGTTGETAGPNVQTNNDTAQNSDNGQTSGLNNQNNNVNPESTSNEQDENQENRPPGGQWTQTVARPDGRCHPCPQFDNEIHHMCPSVCGRGPRLITIRDGEQAEEDGRLMRQYGAVRYTRFGPPFRGPPWPPALWDVYAWDMIPDPNDPTRLYMRPVREGAAGTPEPVGSPSITRSSTRSRSNQTASPPDMYSQISNFGAIGYVPTPIRIRNRDQRTSPPRTPSPLNTLGSTVTSPLNVNLTQSPPRSSASGCPVTVYDTTFNNDRFTFSVSPLNPGVEFSPLQLTPIVLNRRAQIDDEETSPTNYDAEDSAFRYTLRLAREAGSTPAALTTRRPPRLIARGSPEGNVTIYDEGVDVDGIGEVGEPTFVVEFVDREREPEIPEVGDTTRSFLGGDEDGDEDEGDIILGISPRNLTPDIDYEEEVEDGLPRNLSAPRSVEADVTIATGGPASHHLHANFDQEQGV
jgi:hypothetical protein